MFRCLNIHFSIGLHTSIEKDITMVDWRRIIGFEQHTYVQTSPMLSFLLSGVSYYTDIIETIQVNDILKMEFELENKYDNKAITITKNNTIYGYARKDSIICSI